MGREIYTFAYIKALNDQNKDYLETFLPLCILVIPDNNFIDKNTIQNNLSTQFNLDVPLHVLDIIFAKGIEKKLLEQTRNFQKYKLTQEGINYLEKIERPEEVERRINELIEDIKNYFNQLNKNYISDQIYDILTVFLNKNREPIISLLNPSCSIKKVFISKLTEDESILIKYIELAGDQKPSEYQTIQEMIFGSILSSILYSDNLLDFISTNKFNNTTVFLDTNFIFSLLKMHLPENRNIAANELFEILKKFNFKIKVFDFTINEAVGVINGYIEKSYLYPRNIKINSIYSSLKKRGWTKIEARRFIFNIEIILLDLGIQIENTNIDLSSYKPTNELYNQVLAKHKDLQEPYNRNHDLAAIEKIIEIRGKKFRRIEETNAFFLSSDTKLSKLNFYDMGHKDDGTICEVILDRFITTLLWLKNPNIKLSLKTLIITYSRDLAIKRRIWEKFYKILEDAKKDGEINDDEISMLFYHDYIEGILNKFDESDINLITKEFAIEKIEQTARLKEKDTKTEIEKETKSIGEKLGKEFLEKLDEEKRGIEQEKDKELKEKVNDLKGIYKEESLKTANKYVLFIRAGLGLILFVPMIYLPLKMTWNDFFIYIGIIEAIAIIIGIIIDPIKIWAKFNNYLSNKIYSKRVKSADLERL